MSNQEKDIGSFESDQSNLINDYSFLLQKLKSISESIHLLENKFFKEEKKNFEK